MKLTLSMILFLVAHSFAAAPAVFVSSAGSDQGDGSQARPFATLERAKKAVQQLKASAHPVTITVSVEPGTYYLAQPLVLGPQDSGNLGAPVVYEALGNGVVVLSGGRRLALQWLPYRDGIFRAKVPVGLKFDQLFVNGVRQILARYPNFDPAAQYYNGASADAISPERASRWKDPVGGIIHAMHALMWGDYHYRITGKDKDNHLSMEGGWQNNRKGDMHASIRFVENIFEELDAPGEWFLNRKESALYFLPPKGLNLSSAIIECPVLESVLEFRGSQQNPVRQIRFEGFTFRHTLRTFMQTREPLLRGDWAIYRGGAVFLDGAEDIALDRLWLDSVGGNGIFVSNYGRRIRISGSRISGAGASSLCFVGDPKAVRSPLFEYYQTQSLDSMDHAAGPLTANYPADCIAYDNLLNDSGRFEKQSAGVEISMASSITVSHNSIYHVPRAGININDGTWGGHIIEFNDVFDTVLETGDHGSFNSWGRDRFWNPDRSITDTWVKKVPQLPFWDCIKPIVLRNNRWSCHHGWDIDLDDGSSNYEIYNNLCLNGGLKNREGYGRKVYNNIMVNNGFHPHVWYLESGDAFTRNIVFAPYNPAGMEHWGRGFDYNFFQATEGAGPAEALQKLSGQDKHSIKGDALFTDAKNGDFSVLAGSPALKLGFRNFPMNEFGVVSPKLRQLAATPFSSPQAIPSSAVSGRADAHFGWLDAELKNLKGLGEMSATGMGSETGVVVIGLPENGIAWSLGLRKGDVLLSVAGRPTDDGASLAKILSQLELNKQVELAVQRDQSRRSIKAVLPAGAKALKP